MIVTLPGHGDVDLNVATCSYKAFAPAMGVPVRTSVGAPRFWKKGELAYIAELAPFGLRDVEHKAVFEPLYRQRIGAHGVVIVEQLVALTVLHPDTALVLLCYEDAYGPDWCHRHIAAAWLHEQLGLDVPELQPRPDEG